jgi:hypothetical protein
VTRPIDDLNVPLPRLQQQIADLVARQNEQRATESAARLRALLAPNQTTPKEAS